MILALLVFKTDGKRIFHNWKARVMGSAVTTRRAQTKADGPRLSDAASADGPRLSEFRPGDAMSARQLYLGR